MRVLIFGAGAQGRVTLDIVRACHPGGDIAFVDEQPGLAGREVSGHRVLAMDEAIMAAHEPHGAVIAIGQPPARLAMAKRLLEHGIQFMNAVHPRAAISDTAQLGRGNIIGPGVTIDTDSVLADHCILNPGVVIAHDCTIGSGVLFGPGACVGGRVAIGEAAFIGLGANVVSRTTLGDGAVIGAASTVLEDVPVRTVVIGTPARVVSQVDEASDWSRLL